MGVRPRSRSNTSSSATLIELWRVRATRRNRSLFLSDTVPNTGRVPHAPRVGPPLPGTRLEQFVLASEQLSGEDHWHGVEENTVIGVDSGLVYHQWKVQDLDGALS